jgi:serine/threonine protein kinase/Tfp pilus assembly protein PilF
MIGTKLAHYEITSHLGSGGMGDVYQANDTKLGRSVAIKFLPEAFSHDADRVARFQREGRVLASLNHNNIAAIYGVEEINGRHFLVMELVLGETLSDRIKRGAIPIEEALPIAKQIAEALEEAHEKGIIHRDLKPANIKVTKGGTVKVLDFGLARMREAEGALTNLSNSPTLMTAPSIPGVIMGTAAYMSPEQASGQEVDQRSDIFSSGVVLYEMITGRSPFLGESNADTLGRILHTHPPPVSRTKKAMPRELERIISKCLEKDRERRYQSARELFVDLNNLQRNTGSSVTATLGVQPGARYKFVWALLGVAAVLLVVAATTLFRRDKTTAYARIDSIVVLPFTNHGGSADSEALCEGLAENLINSLSQVRTLSVIHRTTSRSYKGKLADPRQIGRELNVGAVVTGECSPRADNLNIQVDLMDVASNTTLWADRYPTKLTDIFSVQDAIAAQIADNLRLRLSGEEQQRLTRHGTADPEAYQLYSLARYYALKSTEEGFRKALEFFDEAIKRDPNYAMAYAGKAEAYMIASDLFLPSINAGQLAEDVALRAIGRDDQLSEAHCALAVVLGWYKWDWQSADKQFQLARKLDEASGCVNDAYPYGFALLFLGRFDEALAELNRSLRLDPRSAVRRVNLGSALYYARRYDEAAAELRLAKSLDPNYFLASLWLGLVYAQTGKHDLALSEFRLLPTAEFRDAEAFLAFGLAKAGRIGEARQILDQLLKAWEQARKANRQPMSAWALATLYTALGEKDAAFKWLYQARDERFVVICGLKLDPVYESLHSDKRFPMLIRDIGLEP